MDSESKIKIKNIIVEKQYHRYPKNVMQVFTDYKYKLKLTFLWIQRLIKVRNKVTNKPIRPGIADGGITKLQIETVTIPMQGK